MKLFWYRLKNWEYWSMYIVYMPSFFIWLWYMIKFRSIYFYRFLNPAFPNGGLVGDSKMTIYKLLPKDFYPLTQYIRRNQPCISIEGLKVAGFSFPFIVKPDIGLRGIGVEIVNTYEELTAYYNISKVDFLIQELVKYPNEMGLFYCRFPDNQEGFITGITLKEFLTVKGDGVQTIEQLLKSNNRHALQINVLKNRINLQTILNSNKELCLVPFGNHNRGTAFKDGSHLITPKLQDTFNKLLSQIDGFYYGRLDIRYNSIEDLEQGFNFSIIEINGAKSEPTHIYDPRNSFVDAQREIFRHQRYIAMIVELSKRMNT